MFEHKSEPLLPKPIFYRRILRSLSIGLGIISVSLFLGMCGYHYLEDFSWIDALLDASMILGGMGPVKELHTNAGKVFASCYALYSGIAVLGAAGVIFAPIYHRFIHRFHLEADSDEDSKKNNK